MYRNRPVLTGMRIYNRLFAYTLEKHWEIFRKFLVLERWKHCQFVAKFSIGSSHFNRDICRTSTVSCTDIVHVCVNILNLNHAIISNIIFRTLWYLVPWFILTINEFYYDCYDFIWSIKLYNTTNEWKPIISIVINISQIIPNCIIIWYNKQSPKYANNLWNVGSMNAVIYLIPSSCKMFQPKQCILVL